VTALSENGSNQPDNKETKKRLLESARAEFSEKGYTKASLRKICADAGVTTGALYFFFKDKEDLFAGIVEPPYDELKEILLRHFAEEEEIRSEKDMNEHIEAGHDEFSAELIRHLYANYDAFTLLLKKSQGSRFEGCVDEIVDMVENTYQAMAEKMARLLPDKKVNSYMRHWLTHMIIDAFIHLFTHEKDEQRALANISKIMNFLVKGWAKMILIPKDENE